MKTGFCRPFEKTLMRRNGTRIKVAVQLFPNFDESGNFVGAWNYIHLMDTDRQENIDRTRYFELLFTNSQEAMVLTDLNGKIRLVNQAFAELLKTDTQELQGELLDNLTVEEDLVREKVQHQEILLKQGYTELYEKRLHRLDGTIIPTSVRSVLVNDPGGRAEAIWMIARESSIQRKLIQSLANSERRFRSLFSNSIDAIGLWTVNDELQYANKAYLDLVGYSQEELRNLTYQDFTPPGWEEADQKMSAQVIERGYSDIFEKEVLSKDGRRIPISIRASAMTDSDGGILGSWVIIRDISEHKETLRKLLHSQNMLQQTSRMSRVGGWEFDLHKETFVITEETFQILSIPRSYHTSLKNIAKLFEPESEQRAVSMVKNVVKSANSGSSELKLLGFSPERWIRVSAQLAYEDSGHKYVYGAVQDITEFMEQQRNLETARDNFQRMAFHDPLTNLPNRLLLEDRFQQITNQARRDQKMAALIIIDLDDFKAINDKHGHPAGDALLVQLAKRLQNTIRSSDTVARLGGDEFVVIAMLKDEQQAISLAEKILDNVKQPVLWQDNIELKASCSMGVAMALDYALSFEALYAQADEALYNVKESGKGDFSVAQKP
jgi:diguanylate cyclase (GGDEF)-like protein/PAS domain S-box-containing protein